MEELYWLIGIILVLLLFLYSTEESFQDTPDTDKPSYNLHSCPNGYTSFRSKDDTLMCCNGEVEGTTCLDKVCTLTKSGSTPLCADILLKEYKEKSGQCPPSMTSYYEDTAKKIKGCTEGLLNTTMTGPATLKQPACMVYDVLQDNINALDSCSNKKEMEEYDFKANCTKSLTQNTANTPVLITVSFTDGNGIVHSAHTRDSMQRFLDATKPGWRDSGIDLNKNISVAEVAKAYYIDKTLSQGDIQN